jgi:V/A-type H+-transporting ATPase subunit I
MLLSMTRVQVVGTKRCQEKVVQLLFRLGTIQVDEWSEGRSAWQRRMVIGDEAVRVRQRLTYAAARVKAVLASLPPLTCLPSSEYEDLYPRPSSSLIETVETVLEEVAPLAQAFAARRAQAEEQFASFTRYEATLQQLLPLIPSIVDLEHFAVTMAWVEHRYAAALEIVTRQLEELSEGRCEVISRDVGQDTRVAVLVFPKTRAKAVNELLGRENITQVRLPAELTGQPVEEALVHLRQSLQAIPRELAEIEIQQQALARSWRSRLLAWQALLDDHLAQIDVRSHFGQTDYTFVIEGWVPERSLPDMEVALQREIGDEVIVVKLPLTAEAKAHAPVMFDNPFFIKPFEPLVRLLSLPRYGAFDPTPLMFIFVPLFYGMILGDIAYGAILLTLTIYLRHRFMARPMIRQLIEVLIIGSAWSILFGFIYGEFLGALPAEKLGLHPLFNRGEARMLPALFLLTIGIGAGHVVLGLCLGVWGAVRRRSRHDAIEKAAMLVSLAGLFLLVAVTAESLPSSLLTPGIALTLVGLAILIYSLGGMGLLLGPLELLSTVGNILSYLRIAAIGLSSVYLAQVANELAGNLGNLLVGIIVAALFHALNVALGAFSPTIHSLRLHYVECFTKFYEGGGRVFRPCQRSIARRELSYPSTKGG